MNKKIILTSILALCIAGPAFADDDNRITDENDPTVLAQGKGCNEDTLNVTEGIANIEAIWNPIEYQCTAGQYLFVGQENDQDVVACRTCTPGSYCGGAPQDNPYTVESHANDILSCSTVGDTTYTQSDSGSSTDTSCYKACTLETANINHATNVVGRDYYGAGTDTCSATSCDDGYHVVATVGQTTFDASVEPEIIEYGYIDNSGTYGTNFGSQRNQSFYALMDNNTWAVYMDGYGMMKGTARCSNANVVNAIGSLVREDVTDDTGNSENCWCRMDAYRAGTSGLYRHMQSQWVYHGNLEDMASGCAGTCAQACANDLAGFRKGSPLLFRGMLYGSIDGASATCSANTIGLNWWSENNEGLKESVSVQQSAEQCTYGGILTIPDAQHVPSKPGHTFGGWRVFQQQASESPIRD